ncbi:MAG: hypothetical protein OXG41_00685 [Acidimicrobiaceae bacterium]|nr:hypothetical protein [Acidimicrobiaceae bacterium]
MCHHQEPPDRTRPRRSRWLAAAAVTAAAAMNRRLAEVATAHRVGVRLRWRRSRELDDATALIVELLSKTPDLRSDDEPW